jgi:hypothetical protein
MEEYVDSCYALSDTRSEHVEEVVVHASLHVYMYIHIHTVPS